MPTATPKIAPAIAEVATAPVLSNHHIPTSAPIARPHARPIAPPSTNRPPILVWIRRCSGVSRCVRGGSSFMDDALPDLCLARTQDRKEVGRGKVEGRQAILRSDHV